MTLLAGCYERFLFGYKLGDGQEEALQRSFTHAAHKSVVKCVAAAGPYAASGGADDCIHLYDLKNDKDLGFLMSPGEGAVTALAFFTPPGAYAPSHLLSGAADGSITVWSVGGGWEAMKTMRGHRKDVSAIAVHPSGMLALSVSRDGTLRMWDLVKGRGTYTVRLEAEAEAVAFSPDDGGARYALLAGPLLTLHSAGGEGGVLASLAHPRRALCMAWAPGGRVLSGSEDGSLRLWDSKTGTEQLCISRAHASRIRSLALVPNSSVSSSSEEGEQPLLVATASTDGSIKLWDLNKAAAAAPGAGGAACLAEVQTRARLTCLAAADSVPVMVQRVQAAGAAKQKAAQAAAKQQAAKQQQQAQQPAPVAAAGKKRKQEVVAGGKPGKHQPAKQQEERPAKKQQQQQQQKQQEQQDRPAKRQATQQEGAQQQAGGIGKAPGPKPAAAKPAAAKPVAAAKPGAKPYAKPGGRADGTAVAEDGVVVHDGVVEFLDSPDQQKKQKKKQKQVAQKRRAAAAKGTNFRAMPGREVVPGQQQRRQRPKKR